MLEICIKRPIELNIVNEYCAGFSHHLFLKFVIPNIFVSNIAVYLITKKAKRLKAPCQAGTTASPKKWSIRVVKRAMKQKLRDVCRSTKLHACNCNKNATQNGAIWRQSLVSFPVPVRRQVIFQIRVSVLDVVSKSKCHEQWRGAAEPLFVALWDLEAKSKTLTRIRNGSPHIIRYS